MKHITKLDKMIAESIKTVLKEDTTIDLKQIIQPLAIKFNAENIFPINNARDMLFYSDYNKYAIKCHLGVRNAATYREFGAKMSGGNVWYCEVYRIVNKKSTLISRCEYSSKKQIFEDVKNNTFNNKQIEFACMKCIVENGSDYFNNKVQESVDTAFNTLDKIINRIQDRDIDHILADCETIINDFSGQNFAQPDDEVLNALRFLSSRAIKKYAEQIKAYFLQLPD